MHQKTLHNYNFCSMGMTTENEKYHVKCLKIFRSEISYSKKKLVPVNKRITPEFFKTLHIL